MTRFVGTVTSILLTALWLPVSGIADEGGKKGKPNAGTQETQAQSATSSDKTAKKPDQKDVRSRGLFAKKKKKQVGGSAGHTEEPQADQSNDSDKVQERAIGPGHFRR